MPSVMPAQKDIDTCCKVAIKEARLTEAQIHILLTLGGGDTRDRCLTTATKVTLGNAYIEQEGVHRGITGGE